MACIKKLGRCPCPACIVSMGNCEDVGTVSDDRFRRRHPRVYSPVKVKKARRLIFEKGVGVGSARIEKILGGVSAAPVRVSLSLTNDSEYSNNK